MKLVMLRMANERQMRVEEKRQGSGMHVSQPLRGLRYGDKSDLLLRRERDSRHVGQVKGAAIILLFVASLGLGLAGCHKPSKPAAVTTDSLVSGAIKDIEDKKYDAALAKLDDANKRDPNSAFILNLYGAVWTKKKDFEKSKDYYEQALMADPQFFPARFNIGEILFLQKKYPEALAYFASMHDRNPDNELLQFKVFLSLLMTNQIDEAKRFLPNFKYPGETPAWYFARAALAAKQGDKQKAVENVTAARMFFTDKCAIFIETFEDLGWPTK